MASGPAELGEAATGRTETPSRPLKVARSRFTSIRSKNITCEVGFTETGSRNESRHEMRVLRARPDK